jgi:transcriptional regulator with XRE-family HTH domain
MKYRIDHEQVARLRIKSGLSKRAAAELLETSLGYYRKLEAGRSSGGLDTLVRLSVAYKVPMSKLVIEDDRAEAA